jgi:hypothetical protein
MVHPAADPRSSQPRGPAAAGLSLLVLIALVAAGTPALRPCGRSDSAVPSSGERGLIRQVSHTLAQVVRRAVRIDRVRPAALLWQQARKPERLAPTVPLTPTPDSAWLARLGPLTLLDLPPPAPILS